MLFDRICRENGIKHLLTAPRSPTTTGKVERFHKTLRAEFLTGQVFASVEEAQAALDVWVQHYNHERPHQGIGMVAPYERFRLAEPSQAAELPKAAAAAPKNPAPSANPTPAPSPASPAATRRVGANGLISFAAKYRAGVWLAGQDVTVVCDGALVHLQHRGVLVATHARRHSVDKQAAGLRRAKPAKDSVRRPTPTAASVTRKVDSSGNVCFAGSTYRAGSQYRRRQVQVAVVGDMVEISIGNELIRCYPVKHDRTREHGALANPAGRPRRINAAEPALECRPPPTGAKVSCGYRDLTAWTGVVSPGSSWTPMAPGPPDTASCAPGTGRRHPAWEGMNHLRSRCAGA